MKLAGKLKDNPMNIAAKIIDVLNSSSDYNVSVAAPGFINFILSDGYIFKGVNKVLESGDSYGQNNLGSGKKINIEFVSANPTGILHLGKYNPG